MPNISRSKDNQTMKLGQLIEYNMKKKKKEKSHTQNAVEILFPDPFLKNQSWPYLWINSQKFYTACFYCMPGWGLSKYIKLRCRPLAFISCKAFLKNKKRSRTSLPVSFSQSILKKNMSHLIFYYLTKFSCLVKFTLWDIGQYVYCNCLLTMLWRHKFRN